MHFRSRRSSRLYVRAGHEVTDKQKRKSGEAETRKVVVLSNKEYIYFIFWNFNKVKFLLI